MNDTKKNNAARMDAALKGHDAIVRIFGRATFTAAPDLKQFGTIAMQNGYQRIVLNMENCETMDSTFMGMLTGLALRMKKNGGKGVFMLNLSAKNREILSTLGVDHILKCHPPGEGPEELQQLLRHTTIFCPLKSAGTTNHASASEMLEAHNNLIEADPANLMKFKDVIDFLRSDSKQTPADEA